MMFNRTRKALISLFVAVILFVACMLTLTACGGKTLDKIGVTAPPTKTKYVEGEKFDPAGMAVTAYYSDGTYAEITDYTLRPDASVALDTTYTKVTVFYTEGDITKSADISITVKEATPPAPPQKTIVTALPSKPPKLNYFAGETFSVEGMEWSVGYSDLSTETIKFTAETEYTVDITRPLAVGDALVKVTYGGYTMPIIIVVSPKAAVGATVKTQPQTDYIEGEYFVADGMIWEITYTDGSNETVTFTKDTEYTVDFEGALDRAVNQVSVTYAGITKKIGINVLPAPSPSAKIVDHEILKGCKTEYFTDEYFDVTGLTVMFTYSDGGAERVEFTIDTDGLVYPTAKLVVDANLPVIYKGYTFEIAVTVKEPAVKSITLVTPPDKTRYFEGEIFDINGMKVRVIWEDGFSTDVTLNSNNAEFSNSALKVSDTSVTVRYLDPWSQTSGTVEVPVTVVGVKSVTVKAQPVKKKYVEGEYFDAKGMTVTVTYTDGASEDVDIVKGVNAIWADDALREATESITVYYGFAQYATKWALTVDIEIIAGVYIEAENARIEGADYDINDNAVDKNGVNNASGGKYVANLQAGDSVTFSFNSDVAGNGSVAFVLASQYLLEDNNWTPISMGNCRFNVICEFWLNGVKQSVDDGVILPGGEADDRIDGEAWLWYNWQEVVLNDIPLIQGRNDVVLKFIPHSYNDCSQSSFNGKFGANVDSLKVTSLGCEVTPCDLSVTFDGLEASLSEENGTVYYVISGNANYVDLRKDEVERAINFGLELNKVIFGGNGEHYLDGAEDREVTFTDDTRFTVKVALNGLEAGGYLTLFGVSADGVTAGLISGSATVNEERVFLDGYYYYLVENPSDGSYRDCVAFVKESAKHVEDYTAELADIDEQDGKVVLTLSGEITYCDFTEEEAAAALKNLVKVYLKNASGNYALKISYATVSNSSLTDTDINGVKKYGADYAVTAVLSDIRAAGVYSVFFKNTDKTVFGLVGGSALTHGSYIYRIDGDADGSALITVATAADARFSIDELTDVEIAEENGKAVYILKGSYTAEVFTDEEIEYLLSQEYFDLQANPNAAGEGRNYWARRLPELIGVTVSGGSFELRYDMSKLPAYCYTSHFGLNEKGEGADLKISVSKEDTITVGYRTYTLISRPYSSTIGENYWNCVGIEIESAFSERIAYAVLEEVDGKPYLVLRGSRIPDDGYTDEQVLALLEEECRNCLFSEWTNIPDFASTDKNWTTTPVSVEAGTVKLNVDGYFEIMFDLSVGTAGQALFLHFSFNGDTTDRNLYCNCTYGSIYVNGLAYSLVHTDDSASDDWTYRLVTVQIEKA